MLTRILFLADVSPFSERALAWASEKLKGQQTDFLVLHVVDPAAGMEAPTWCGRRRDTSKKWQPGFSPRILL